MPLPLEVTVYAYPPVRRVRRRLPRPISYLVRQFVAFHTSTALVSIAFFAFIRCSAVDFSTLYQHYKDPLIERIGKIVRCRESAKDIVQESYLVLMQRLAGQSITNPRAYLDRA